MIRQSIGREAGTSSADFGRCPPPRHPFRLIALFSVRLLAAGVALAVSLGAASISADARTPGHHKHPANHGAAVSAVARSNAGRAETAATQGSAVSTLATGTTMTGEAKGDAISALARSGHGRAK